MTLASPQPAFPSTPSPCSVEPPRSVTPTGADVQFQKLNLTLTPAQGGEFCPYSPHLPDEDTEAPGGGRIRTRSGALQRLREGRVCGWGTGRLSGPQGETRLGDAEVGASHQQQPGA